MDIDLARKLLGVDGSDAQTLEAAWSARRHQILQQRRLGDAAEVDERNALLANLDRARAVLKDAAHISARSSTRAGGADYMAMREIWLGAAFGILASALLLILIAWLTGHFQA